MLYHMPPLTKETTGGMIHLTSFSFSATSSLRELRLPPRKIGMARETCLFHAFFLGEVKLSAIFSLEEKNLPLGEVKLSLVNIILYLREMGPPFGNISLSRETCLSPTFFLGEFTFPTYFSFRVVNYPLGEKGLFLEEHSLNLPASFSLGEMNLPHGEVVLSATFSLRGTNSSSEEFVLPFGKNLLSLENRLCCSVPCCIPT